MVQNCRACRLNALAETGGAYTALHSVIHLVVYLIVEDLWMRHLTQACGSVALVTKEPNSKALIRRW